MALMYLFTLHNINCTGGAAANIPHLQNTWDWLLWFLSFAMNPLCMCLPFEYRDGIHNTTDNVQYY